MHDTSATPRSVLGEDAQRHALPGEVLLAGGDDHRVAALTGLLLEGRGDLAMDRIAQVGQEEAERPGPADPQAARGGVRDVMEFGGRGLDRLPGGEADPVIVGECSRRGRVRHVGRLGDIGQEDPAARLGRPSVLDQAPSPLAGCTGPAPARNATDCADRSIRPCLRQQTVVFRAGFRTGTPAGRRRRSQAGRAVRSSGSGPSSRTPRRTSSSPVATANGSSRSQCGGL